MTAIVTDAHYRMSVALIRDLFERGVRVVACEKASLENPVGFASRGAAQCITLPDGAYEDALLALCEKISQEDGQKPALLPVGAKTLAILSRNAGRFETVCALYIAQPQQLSLFNDKSAVAALAKIRRQVAAGLANMADQKVPDLPAELSLLGICQCQ